MFRGIGFQPVGAFVTDLSSGTGWKPIPPFAIKSLQGDQFPTGRMLDRGGGLW